MLLPNLLIFLVFGMAASTKVAYQKLNNGKEIPPIALGTYLGFDNNGIIKPEKNQVRDAVVKAIELGYRLIDTASAYGTEHEIGMAVQMKIDSGEVKREDMFIVTKLWNVNHERAKVAVELRESLKNLGMNYVDLFLMHWPLGLNEDLSFSDVDYMETWRGMEDMVKLGLVKSIGISNFNKEQIERLLAESTIKPAVLQIENHPELNQNEFVKFAQDNGLVVMGYSPFGTLVNRFGLEHHGLKFDDPVLSGIAKKYQKTVPQVILRWLVERKVVPVVKSTNPKRQAENINIFDFTLTKEEVERINEFNANVRLVLPSFWQTHRYYPFEKIDNPIPDPFKPAK